VSGEWSSGRASRCGIPSLDDTPRLSVALTIDHDAISDSVRRGDSPVKFSHAEFGPRVGAKRLLVLLERRGSPATWFVPGHTLTTFTDDTDAILAGGHELACHGWFHEDFAELGVDQTRGPGSVDGGGTRGDGCGSDRFSRPVLVARHADARLVEAAGFAYDSSLMADDDDLQWVRRGDDTRCWRARSGAAERARGGAGLLGDGRLALLRARSWPPWAVGAVGRPRGRTEELRYAHEHAPRRW
jgi:hypothetical protein